MKTELAYKYDFNSLFFKKKKWIAYINISEIDKKLGTTIIEVNFISNFILRLADFFIVYFIELYNIY